MTSRAPDAVLFDMDGLLVETESIWYQVECEVAAGLGLPWSAEDSAQMLGGPIGKVVTYLRGLGAGEPAEVIRRRLLDGMSHALRTTPIHWQPGALELLTALRDAEVPRALVSASLRAQVDAVLERIGEDLPDAFLTTVAAEDCPRTKPYPDPYLEAARRLDAAPERCVVLEDSPTGVAAGVAAGAYVVAVPHVVDIPPRPGVRVVATLESITIADLADWIAAAVSR